MPYMPQFFARDSTLTSARLRIKLRQVKQLGSQLRCDRMEHPDMQVAVQIQRRD